MFLKEVRIKNFRSLKDIRVPLSKNTILIGENNSGKTAFLDAIKLGLGRSNKRVSPFNEYDYYVNDEKSEPKNSDGIIIEFIFREEKPNQWPEKIPQILGEIVQPIMWEEDEEEAINQIWLRVFSRYDESQKDFIIETDFLNTEGETLSGKASNSKYNDFLQLTPVFYLQALRDIHDTFSSNSPFWGRFLKKVNIPDEKLWEIQNSLSKTNEEIIKSDSNLEELIKSLESIHKVLSLNDKEVVSINALPLKTWDILSKSQVVMKGKGSNVDFPLDRHGQGTQSLATLFLFQAYIDVLLKTTFEEETEAILTLEEPEAHLHPQASRSLASKINKIDCQKIISTHSPYFVQNMNLMDLRLFRKTGSETFIHYLIDKVEVTVEGKESLLRFIKAKGGKFSYNEITNKLVAFEPISEQESRGLYGMYKDTEFAEVIDNFIAKSQLILTKEERNDLFTFVQRTRGELFFARGWLLAEGQTEYILLQYFSEILDLPLDDYGISIIDYQNNGSPGAFIKLAKLLDFPWLLLSDNDDQGESTLAQIEKIGYKQEEIEKLVSMLPQKDFETYLAYQGFIEEFKAIAIENGYTISEDALGMVDKDELAEIIKKDKVGNANRLVEILKDRNSNSERVPKLVHEMIERSVSISNE
ncbi:ATP-dependent nuclease [Ornithinibacillus californiensis]|uniref:ATP-dependent nuclease n=1 Tax=Ornithinibacillus californiensis TaxID=161536 RepID=UPI00064DF38A|nr:AAA family ATPase [Ornithinibacillus californiensis]